MQLLQLFPGKRDKERGKSKSLLARNLVDSGILTLIKAGESNPGLRMLRKSMEIKEAWNFQFYIISGFLPWVRTENEAVSSLSTVFWKNCTPEKWRIYVNFSLPRNEILFNAISVVGRIAKEIILEVVSHVKVFEWNEPHSGRTLSNSCLYDISNLSR